MVFQIILQFESLCIRPSYYYQYLNVALENDFGLKWVPLKDDTYLGIKRHSLGVGQHYLSPSGLLVLTKLGPDRTDSLRFCMGRDCLWDSKEHKKS